MTDEEKGRAAFTRAVLRYMDIGDFESASKMVICLVKGDTDKANSLIESAPCLSS